MAHKEYGMTDTLDLLRRAKAKDTADSLAAGIAERNSLLGRCCWGEESVGGIQGSVPRQSGGFAKA